MGFILHGHNIKSPYWSRNLFFTLYTYIKIKLFGQVYFSYAQLYLKSKWILNNDKDWSCWRVVEVSVASAQLDLF